MKKNNQIEEKEMPMLTQVMLTPERAVYEQCSPYTQNNMTSLAKILAFTVPTCGFILGASLTRFCFHGSPVSYALTVPIGILTYWFMDRLVVMADARKNARFIRRSRYFISLVFGIFNSFLIDTYFYDSDITAALNTEQVTQEVVVQHETDSLKSEAQAHKEATYTKINTEAARLRDRNNELVKEVEGAGYDHHFGRGPVYEERRAVLDRETADFERNKTLLLAEAAKDDSTMAQLDRDAVKKKAKIPSQISSGINHSMELLHNVIMRKPFNLFVAVLFALIAMVLELLPLLAKHYIDISEYFEHALYHIEAHLATAEMKKEQTIEQEQHRSGLANERAKKAEAANHAMKSFENQMVHHGRIVDATGKYFETISGKKSDMKERFADYFDEHINPIFNTIFEKFHEGQDAAFNPAMPNVEPENSYTI